jgi:hypothetical protein
MRRRVSIVAALVAVEVAACGWINGLDEFNRKKGDPPEDTSASSSSSGSGGAGGTGTSSTGSAGGGACDALGLCEDSGDPADCLGCALLGDCADELLDCQNEQQCVDYVGCIDACVDQACYDTCYTAFPLGGDLYDRLAICAICEQCPVSCDAAGSGC